MAIDRKAIARRRLGELRNLEDRLKLVLTSELGAELIEILPEIIEQDACKFALYNTPCPTFDGAGTEPVGSMLFVWLEFHVGVTHASVNFAGLMRQYGSTDKAANIVMQIVGNKLRGSDYTAALQATINQADLWAVRSHFPVWGLRDCVELAAFYTVLKKPTALGEALALLPIPTSAFRIPTHEQLIPVADHLRSIGIDQIIIDDMIEAIFKINDALVSLDKVVALAAIHGKGVKMTTEELLQSQLSHILNLHFRGISAFSRKKHMQWMIENRLLGDNVLATNSPVRGAFNVTLIEALSWGKLAAVFQFLCRFVTHKKAGRVQDMGYRAAEDAAKYINHLLPHAFKVALERGEYGTAAAIGQITREINEEDRDRALELALAHNQRIAIQWAHVLN